MARSLSDGSALSPSSFPFSGRGSRAEPILTRWPVVQTQRRGHAGARRCQLPSEPPTLTPQPRSGLRAPIAQLEPSPAQRRAAFKHRSDFAHRFTGTVVGTRQNTGADGSPALCRSAFPAPEAAAPARGHEARLSSRRLPAPRAALPPCSPPPQHLSSRSGKRVNKGYGTRAQVHRYTLIAYINFSLLQRAPRSCRTELKAPQPPPGAFHASRQAARPHSAPGRREAPQGPGTQRAAAVSRGRRSEGRRFQGTPRRAALWKRQDGGARALGTAVPHRPLLAARRRRHRVPQRLQLGQVVPAAGRRHRQRPGEWDRGRERVGLG